MIRRTFVAALVAMLATLAKADDKPIAPAPSGFDARREKIEQGKLTYPVKGATLIGNGPDALTRVSMVGTDFELDSGVGMCGKDGQSVPVGVGQPTLRIDQLVVGGTQA